MAQLRFFETVWAQVAAGICPGLEVSILVLAMLCCHGICL